MPVYVDVALMYAVHGQGSKWSDGFFWDDGDTAASRQYGR